MSPTGSRRVAFHLLVFLTAAAIVVSRRPDALFNAQFFAEDGAVWFPDAYNFGFRCLVLTNGGYLHTLTRLIALLSVLFPFIAAPVVMNLCALFVQVLPANLFLSDRFSQIPMVWRLLWAFLYVALPDSFEIDANITTIQWHLALTACLVLFALPAKSWGWRVFDIATLVLISVDGPLGILLVPVAATLWWIRRTDWARALCLAVFQVQLSRL
jgi:hypothetical protein